MSSYLSKKDILSADDLQTIEKYIEEWGGTVRISEMSADARDYFEQYLANIARKNRDEDEQYYAIRAPLCAMCIVDEKADCIFTFGEVEKLGQKNAKAIDKIFEEANKLNKVFGQEREDVAKNSEEVQTGNEGGE